MYNNDIATYNSWISSEWPCQ